MQGKDALIIKKIIKYIDDIADYTADMNLQSFQSDSKTVSACAFSIAQIGELAKFISDETQAKHANIPWNAMRGMRNKIVHDYDNIDLIVLWGTIEKSLPELKAGLEHIQKG